MRSLVLVLLALFSLPVSAREAESTRAAVASTAMPGGLTHDVVLCDVDANGTRDVVLLRAVDGFGQYVNVVALRNGGAGTLADPVVTDAGLLNYGSNRVVCGRADLDSFADVVVGNGTDARVLRGSGDGSFTQHQSLTNARPQALGFFNGDSFPDLFLSEAQPVWMGGAGDGTFVTPAAPTGLFGLLADVTGDGRTDSVQTYYPFRSYVNDGSGNVVLAQEDQSVGEQGVVADFTGEGAADVLMSANGGVSFRRGNGDGTFDPEVRSTISPSPFGNWYAHRAEALDADADGILDFTYGFRAYLSDGAGSFKSRVIRAHDPGDVFSRWGDMNGDGRADLVLVDRNSAAVQIIATTPPTASRLPSIAFTRSEASVGYAQQVTYRAEISGAVPLSGAVRFRVNGATVGLVDVDASGVAELTFGLPRGATTVIATYTGDPEYAEASATMSFEVVKAPTSVSIYPDRNPRKVYQTVQIFTGLYVGYASASGFPRPSGALEVTRDGISLGVPDADTGRLVTSFPEAGERIVRVEYPGDDNYLGSAAEYVQIVEKGTAPFAVQIPESIVQGTPVMVTAHVGGGDQNQTGSVVFTIDGAVAATQSLTGHSVTAELTFPASGVRTLTVAYSGDANWLAQERTFTVNVASTAWLVRPVLSASARTGEANLQWNAIPQATSYVVWRKLYHSDPWQPIATVAAPNITLTVAQTASMTNAYAVSATKADGTASLLSVADIATTNVLGSVSPGTPIHAYEIHNLLTSFGDVYAFAGRYLQSPSLDVTQGSLVKAADLQKLRDAAQSVREHLGLPVPTFTDPVLTPGQSVIRAIHFNELKDAVD